MYTIGRFASIGRVTVRMLRHWDEIGLLEPARVDPATGYRSYAPEQVADLAEIVRLRDLGLGLVDVGRVLRAGDASAARAVLESAREELRRSLAADTDRLARFDAYLRDGEGGTPMSTTETPVELAAVPAQRVAVLTRRAAGFGSANIGPVVGPMFPEVLAHLDAAGVGPSGPAVAVYSADESGDGSGVLITAGFEVGDDVADVPGVEVRVLPALEQAAVTTHHGSVDGIDEAWMGFVERVKAQGAVPSGPGRELYLTPGDRPQAEWVTRLVQPVERRG
jgi:DNA-binding transcriptional MerR regulator/effector-binding domain-containing protein